MRLSRGPGAIQAGRDQQLADAPGPAPPGRRRASGRPPRRPRPHLCRSCRRDERDAAEDPAVGIQSTRDRPVPHDRRRRRAGGGPLGGEAAADVDPDRELAIRSKSSGSAATTATGGSATRPKGLGQRSASLTSRSRTGTVTADGGDDVVSSWSSVAALSFALRRSGLHGCPGGPAPAGRPVRQPGRRRATFPRLWADSGRARDLGAGPARGGGLARSAHGRVAVRRRRHPWLAAGSCSCGR